MSAATRRRRFLVALGAAALGCASAPPAGAEEVEADPPEVTLGERLFLETRFAESFARFLRDEPGASANDPLPAGDPVVETTATPGEPLPGPFAGQTMNCRACHLVDEQLDVPGGGMRTYGDFARRSPVAAREDGLATAARNAPPLVNASLPRPGGTILHFDGEFPSLELLVKGTIAGRNYGWLPGERSQAVAHAARVIRDDDGSGALAAEFGGSYRDVLSGAPGIPAELLLPPELRIDVDAASDEQLFETTAALVAAYVGQLEFARDEEGRNIGSPYDRFLERNSLPRAPDPGEPAAAYTKRLRRALARLGRPVFVDEGPFEFHAQARVFGPTELAGLRVFLASPGPTVSPRELERGGAGNCAACHPAPDFTDFLFHNTGATQVEYDVAHGEGAFRRVEVPGLAQRSRSPEAWLPATEAHPDAREPFRRPADPAQPGHADLGVWNVFANPDFPEAQAPLRRSLCEAVLGAPPPRRPGPRCREPALLRRSVARFKTPGLRDLEHSAPFLHTGGFDALEDVVEFYRDTSALARAGRLRNGDREIRRIALVEADVAALAAFLRSLDEDYE